MLIIAYGVQKVICAKQIVNRPKSNPRGTIVAINNNANEIAVIGSGIPIDTLDILIIGNVYFVLAFQIPKHVIVPMMTDTGTTINETIRELNKTFKNSLFLNKVK
jgi:hypothetical protein